MSGEGEAAEEHLGWAATLMDRRGERESEEMKKHGIFFFVPLGFLARDFSVCHRFPIGCIDV
jgi:hypothetical protein